MRHETFESDKLAINRQSTSKGPIRSGAFIAASDKPGSRGEGHADVGAAVSSAVGASAAAPVIVTIDGPAASGKSSVSRELARRFGWSWVSTGSFYRGIAWAAGYSGLDLEDEEAIVKLVESGRWEVRLTSEQTLFLFEGVDRTEDIGKEAVGAMASKISSYPLVRLALLQAQRDCAKIVGGLIAEGRDCGSIVFPQARLKVFLTARAEDRAQRRAMEEGRSLESMISEQTRRDHQDANRKAAPMRAPDGSHTIDTSQLGFEEVVGQIATLIEDQGLIKTKAFIR
jgi:cytidylate kinase